MYQIRFFSDKYMSISDKKYSEIKDEKHKSFNGHLTEEICQYNLGIFLESFK